MEALQRLDKLITAILTTDNHPQEGKLHDYLDKYSKLSRKVNSTSLAEVNC